VLSRSEKLETCRN